MLVRAWRSDRHSRHEWDTDRHIEVWKSEPRFSHKNTTFRRRTLRAEMLPSRRARNIFAKTCPRLEDDNIFETTRRLKDAYILNDMRLQSQKAESTTKKFWSCIRLIMSDLDIDGCAYLSTSMILRLRSVSKTMKDCVSKFWLKPVFSLTPRGSKRATTHFFAAFRSLSIEFVNEDCINERYWLKSILNIRDLQDRNFHIKMRIPSHQALQDLAKLLHTNHPKFLSIFYCGDIGMSLNSFRTLGELVQNLEIEFEGCTRSLSPFPEILNSVQKISMVATIRVLDLRESGTITGADTVSAFRALLTELTELHSLKLSTADMDRSGAEDLAGSLASIVSLTELELDGYKDDESATGFDGLGATALAPALARLTAIKTLDLEGNSVGDAGAVALLNALAKPCSLKLDSSGISSVGAKSISEILRSKTCLTELHLNNSETENGFGDGGATILAASLIFLTALRKLQLQGNSICDLGATTLASALKNLTLLQLLSLNENKLGPSGVKAMASVLALPKLSVLDISCNNLGDTGAVIAASALAGLALSELDIGHNGITDPGASALALCLAGLTSLQNLNIGGNDFGVAGVQQMAWALPRLRILETLSLECIFLGDSGLEMLASTLVSLTSLQALDISYNALGSGPRSLGLIFAAQRPTLISLKWLDLKCNDLGSTGASALAAALVGRTALQSLDVASNHIGDSGAAALASSLAALASLSTAIFSDNGISTEGKDGLRRTLTQVRNLKA